MTIALDLGSYSDIRDYASLVDRVLLWLDRGDSELALIPTFIANTEAHLNRVLRTPDMEAFAPVVVSSGVFMLPDDCLQVRGITSRGRPLDATSPEELAGRYVLPSGAYLAGPCASSFAVAGRTVQLAPINSDAVGLSYWQRIPTLSAAVPRNWLIDQHADIYLYGTLAQAYGFIDDPEGIQRATAAFDVAVADLQAAGQRARYGGPIVARSGVRAVRGVRA